MIGPPVNTDVTGGFLSAKTPILRKQERQEAMQWGLKSHRQPSLERKVLSASAMVEEVAMEGTYSERRELFSLTQVRT